MTEKGISVTATISGLTTDAQGGCRIKLHVAESNMEQLKELLAWNQKNVQVAFVLLPEDD